MNKLNCIVHYKGLEPYSPIKVLSEINIQRIHCAKKKREEIGGFHLHEDQINLIPEEIDLETHGIHLEPCYKRYVLFHLERLHILVNIHYESD